MAGDVTYSEDDIQSRARRFIHTFGEDAAIQAKVRVMKYTDEEKHGVAAVWQRVLDAIEKMSEPV